MSQAYEVRLHPAADKQLQRLYRSDRKLAARFAQHIRGLARQPYPTDVKILERRQEYDLCRTRVGADWHLQYAVIGQRLIVLVLEAGPRQGAYQNLVDAYS
jgi:mRNA-degrading endonuclease RelE of RelBE toxin-antitoxin system